MLLYFSEKAFKGLEHHNRVKGSAAVSSSVQWLLVKNAYCSIVPDTNEAAAGKVGKAAWLQSRKLQVHEIGNGCGVQVVSSYPSSSSSVACQCHFIHIRIITHDCKL